MPDRRAWTISGHRNRSMSTQGCGSGHPNTFPVARRECHQRHAGARWIRCSAGRCISAPVPTSERGRLQGDPARLQRPSIQRLRVGVAALTVIDQSRHYHHDCLSSAARLFLGDNSPLIINPDRAAVACAALCSMTRATGCTSARRWLRPRLQTTRWQKSCMLGRCLAGSP